LPASAKKKARRLSLSPPGKATLAGIRCISPSIAFFAATPGAAGYVKMASLFLIRHAQASFLQENYDTLSLLGEAQSGLLGEYWAQHKITFDRACVGPCARHKHTAQLVSEAFRKVGLAFLDQQVIPDAAVSASQFSLPVALSRNSSWSEFLYRANPITLSSFNSHAHIDEPAMLTYR
jgi:hypothetical protein